MRKRSAEIPQNFAEMASYYQYDEVKMDFEDYADGAGATYLGTHRGDDHVPPDTDQIHDLMAVSFRREFGLPCFPA